ncbi:phage tail tape measure protein, partial [Escherichia coli]|uniref:phage tail tape measure protein n=1 Tax=Escherichia coli TaxID=562 RepID=UPI001EDAA585
KNVGTKVPASFEDIGSVVADVNTRMGLSGETLDKVASQYLEAGRILGEEVDIMKTGAAFNAFKIEGEDVSGALDHLFRVSQATGIGMNELAGTVQNAAPAAQALGFSFEETAGMVGT